MADPKFDYNQEFSDQPTIEFDPSQPFSDTPPVQTKPVESYEDLAIRNVQSLGEDNLFSKIGTVVKGSWDERLKEAQGARPGLDPENEFGGDNGIPNPLFIITTGFTQPNLRDVADLGVRGLEYLGAGTNVGLDTLDAGVASTGIDDYVRGPGGVKARPGAALGALMEAFPAGGMEAGIPPAPRAIRGPRYAKGVTAEQVAADLKERDLEGTPEQINYAVDYYNNGGNEASVVKPLEQAALEAAQESNIPVDRIPEALQQPDFKAIVDAKMQGANFPTPESVAPARAPLNDINPAQPFNYDAWENPKQAAPVDEAALEARLQQEAEAFQASRNPTPEDLFKAPDEAPSSPAAPATELPTPSPVNVVDQASRVVSKEDIQRTIADTTKDWKNAPEYEVVDNFDEIQDPAIRQALGEDDGSIPAFIGPDGKVRIIAKNVRSAEDVPAAIFHESLGHHGLAVMYKEELNGVLSKAYDTNDNFRAEVDRWMQENPGAYADDPNPVARAAEEVMAEQSERGVMDVSMLNKIKNTVKKYARRAGIKLDYSDRELNAILGMAHDAVINGNGTAMGGVTRYMKVYHGSGADFNEFDHTKMGSGEGNQVFGWGTYLTDSEKIGRHYQKMIGGEEPSWNGVKGPWYQVRQNMEASYAKQFPDGGVPIARDATMDLFRQKGVKATAEQVADYLIPALKDAPADIKANAIAEITPTVDFVNSKIGNTRKGKLYEVDIPDDANLMHWHQEIKDQPRVASALKDAGIEIVDRAKLLELQRQAGRTTVEYNDASSKLNKLTKEGAPDAELDAIYDDVLKVAESSRKANDAIKNVVGEDWTGEQVYSKLAKREGSAKKASEFLDKSGIDGNKYDAGTLANPDKLSGDSNYVMFNDKTPKITNKFMRNKEPYQKKTMSAEKMETQNDVSDLIDFTASKIEGEKFTIPELKRMATDMGLNAKKYLAQKGLPEDQIAARLLAAKQIFTNTTDELAGLGEELRTKGYSPSLHAKIRQKLAIQEAVAAKLDGDAAEAGRALRVLREVSESKKSVDAQMRYMEKASAKDALSNPETLAQFMENYLQVAKDAGADAAVKYAKKVRKGNLVMDIVNLPRSLMSSVDLSAPLRQGLNLVGTKEFWGSFGKMFGQFVSEGAHEKVMGDIRSRPTYPLMVKSKLGITDRHADLSHREEMFLSKLAGKIPLVKHSERAYNGFLNKLRADTFDSLVKESQKAGIDFGKDPKALKDIAQYINNATGRGELGRFEKAAPLLTGAFFSPRLIASRANMLRPDTYIKLSPVVRRRAIKDLVKMGGIVSTVVGLGAMAGLAVETDPRSSDFAKLKSGNTRYDVLGGYGQYLVLAARLASNEKITAGGDIVPLDGKKFGMDNRLDVTEKFFENKMAPVPAFIASYLRGKDPAGNGFDPKSQAAQMFIPLVAQDIYDVYKDEQGGAGKAAVSAVPAVFGVGVQNYSPREKKDDPKFDMTQGFTETPVAEIPLAK